MRTHLARFPFVKSLETFDFSYQPSLDKKQIQTLSVQSQFYSHERGASLEQIRGLPHEFAAIVCLLVERLDQMTSRAQRIAPVFPVH